jgi:hypothetical protein
MVAGGYSVVQVQPAFKGLRITQIVLAVCTLGMAGYQVAVWNSYSYTALGNFTVRTATLTNAASF